MTLSFGNYEESYPPEILRGYTAPVLSGGARREAGAPVEPTTPPPDLGPESNSPEGAVPVDATLTEPDGVAVVAVPVDQLDEAALAAEPSPTVRGLLDDDGVPLEQPDDPRVAGDEPAEVSSSGQLTAHEGTPGRYEPEVAPKERPRNVTELRERCRPAELEPWVAGSYVLVGTTGKRAHWTGDDWHGDESPGYIDDEPDENPHDDLAAEEAQGEADAQADR